MYMLSYLLYIFRIFHIRNMINMLPIPLCLATLRREYRCLVSGLGCDDFVGLLTRRYKYYIEIVDASGDIRVSC